jgi:hypothetical protein
VLVQDSPDHVVLDIVVSMSNAVSEVNDVSQGCYLVSRLWVDALQTNQCFADDFEASLNDVLQCPTVIVLLK